MNWLNTQDTQFIDKSDVYKYCMNIRSEVAMDHYIQDKIRGVRIL